MPDRVSLSMIGWALGSIGAVAYRELLSLFVTPLAYVVGTLFLLLQGWNFALLLQVLNDPLAAPGPPLQYYFGGSFFIFWLPVIFLCATLSMRLIAEERKQGTYEALLTAPLSPAWIVLGKALGAFAFYVLLWVPTTIFYVMLRGAQTTPDPGPIASGYLGTFLVGASFLGIGLVASALSRSQLGAAIGAFVACTIAVLAGLLVDQVETPWLATLLERTSLLAMMQEMAQGIVDTRWFWIHGTVWLLTIVVARAVVDPRRTAETWARLVLVSVALLHVAAWGVRHSSRQDWTQGRVYSLSERAQTLLAELEQPVDVSLIVPSTLGAGRINPVAGELREVLARMQEVTPKLRVRVLDPDRDRQEAEQLIAQYGVSGSSLADGVVLIKAGQGTRLRREHLYPTDLVTFATGPDVQVSGPRVKAFRGEEALLSAFLRVTDPVEITVCVTQGHGEPALDDLQPFGGYAHLADLLRNAGVQVRAVDLEGSLPLADCDIVLVGGPSGLLPREHVRHIETFAETGGDLLLLTGAVILPERDQLVRHGLEPLTARYGIAFGDAVVLDPHAMPGNTPLLAFTLTEGWGEHESVRALIGRPVSLMLVRELQLSPTDDGIDPHALLRVGEDGWAEHDIAGVARGEMAFDPNADRRGPIVVAAASERGGSRLVVIGSDQFALNAFMREDIAYDHGRDLIVNAVGWLAERRALLGIAAREREHVKLVLLPDQLRRMTLVSMLGLPAFAMILGLWAWWRRRR